MILEVFSNLNDSVILWFYDSRMVWFYELRVEIGEDLRRACRGSSAVGVRRACARAVSLRCSEVLCACPAPAEARAARACPGAVRGPGRRVSQVCGANSQIPLRVLLMLEKTSRTGTEDLVGKIQTYVCLPAPVPHVCV